MLEYTELDNQITKSQLSKTFPNKVNIGLEISNSTSNFALPPANLATGSRGAWLLTSSEEITIPLGVSTLATVTVFSASSLKCARVYVRRRSSPWFDT